MKKLLVLLCLFSFSASAENIVTSCQKFSSRVSDKLKVVELEGSDLDKIFMVVQEDHLAKPIYYFGKISFSESRPWALSTVVEYELVDLKGESYKLGVTTKKSPSRACSLRAGYCESSFNIKTAYLSSVGRNESYYCF